MSEGDLARFIDRWTVEFVRTYPHPIERVWRAVCDPAEVSIWFIPPSVWEMKAGGAYRFEEDFAGIIQAFEPPRLVRFGPKPDVGPWPGPQSFFQFELAPAPGGTRLRYLQHSAPGDPVEPVANFAAPGRPGSLAGWHAAFDELGELLDGAPINARLPPTRLSEIVADWAVKDAAAFSPEQKAQIQRSLRARERWFELKDTYAAHVDATRPRD
ncbi:MAG TPA: SRPBCC domain-containing protein [Caulobacteraceae bacterium]|jgi:uncharacterized protein YndB with AHSA1/START domain